MMRSPWETLEFRGKLSFANFNKKAFLKEIKVKDIQRRYRMFFDSSRYPGEQHSHIDIDFRSPKRGEFTIVFHGFEYKGKGKDEGPPYMEDCVPWFGKFFKNDNMLVDTYCSFEFGDNYSSALALPFPLVTENRELAGSLVMGMNIELVGQTRIKSVIIQTENDLLFVTGYGRARIKLRDFDFEVELNKISDIMMKFVKEGGRQIESRSNKRKRR